MNVKKTMVFGMAAMAAVVATAAPTTRSTYGRKSAAKAAVAEEEEEGPEATVKIDRFPVLGRQATLSAPSLSGESTIGNVFTKPRKWIVLEAKYSTVDRIIDQLTFLFC